MHKSDDICHSPNMRVQATQIWMFLQLYCDDFLTSWKKNIRKLLKPGSWKTTLFKRIPTTRGPKGHISCTWVQCATFLANWPGRPSFFSDRPEKHKLGRGRWDLASCQVSLNSVQRFQRRSRKCLSQSEASLAILFFQSARETQTW